MHKVIYKDAYQYVADRDGIFYYVRRVPYDVVALLSDTGMRLGEAVGLTKSDIVIHAEIPLINLTPHPWRRLKTKGSKRTIPLVGTSLWAAKQSLHNFPNSNFLFPR